MYLEQEAAFLTGKYKKIHGKQKKQSENHWKKAGSTIIKQKYKLT